MAYNFTTGSQKIGPIYSEDDSDGDTYINWAQDAVSLVVNGNPAIVVDANDGISTHHPAVTVYDNDSGAGDILRDGAGSLTAGKLYFMATGSATWTEAVATVASSGSSHLLGIAMGSSPSTHGLMIRGFFDAHTYLSGTHEPGLPVYLSTVGGYMQVHPPSGSGQQLRIIGHCCSGAKVVYFNPSPDWIEFE